MGRKHMRDEYDFSNGTRGRFYRPDVPKRYVITLDHRPNAGHFEIYTDELGAFHYRVKTEDGDTLVTSGPYQSRSDVLEAVEKLRETVIGAEAVEAS
jgi:uncharacterized protein YegP (UPF0339 family)